MGIVNFDTFGVYNFDCSVGFNANADMNLTITVDAFDLNDLMIDMINVQEVPIFLSQYAFSSYTDTFLTQSGPWTIFAPDNDAVQEILELMNLGQFSGLNIPDLTEILEYHIAEGVWLAEDLYDGLQIPTAQGQSLNISQNNGNSFVNGSQITSTNFEAYNGVVHVIDYCLAPQGLPEATVMEIIRKSDNHQILEQAIIALNLDDDLSVQATIDNNVSGPGPWTVFAPNDDAFAILAEELGIPANEILNSQFLSNIVNNHIVNNVINSEDMYAGNLANTLQDEQIEFENNDSIFYVIGEQNTVEITIQDLYAYNGVVHFVDAVISPFIPNLEGTCGTWRLVLESNSETGWGDTELLLYKNNQFFESLTVFNGGVDRIYDFGVDEGDEIDLYVISPGASSQSYKLYNTNQELIVNATQPSGILGSYIDIMACEVLDKNFCSKVEVETNTLEGFGWCGTLDVFRNGVLDKKIDMQTGYKQNTYINTNYYDTLKFVVNNPIYSEDTRYLIYDVNGQLVFEDNVQYIAPQDSPNLIFCDQNAAKSWNCVEDACVELSNNTGDFSSISECQEFCGTSSILKNNIELRIYPNPSSGLFKIQFDAINGEVNIYMTNMLGKEVYKTSVNSNEKNNEIIDLGDISKGIYMLKITNNRQSISEKIIIQ